MLGSARFGELSWQNLGLFPSALALFPAVAPWVPDLASVQRIVSAHSFLRLRNLHQLLLRETLQSFCTVLLPYNLAHGNAPLFTLLA